MFSFGLANFLSLSDRMSDMLKKFSTSLCYVAIPEVIHALGVKDKENHSRGHGEDRES